MVGLGGLANTFHLSRRLTTGNWLAPKGTQQKRGMVTLWTEIPHYVANRTSLASHYCFFLFHPFVSILRGSSFTRWRQQFHSPTLNRTSTPPLPFLGTSRPRSSPHAGFRCGPTILYQVCQMSSHVFATGACRGDSMWCRPAWLVTFLPELSAGRRNVGSGS